MDRCALFVDAGYLLAAGGTLCCGTKNRADIECNYDALVGSLVLQVEGHANMPALRVYWYDAAPKALPLADHLEIGNLRHVKLRLGRLTGGKQKGVDSLIVRDLMTLARERAIASAFVLSGDEDIREGVVAAQDMGVRVTLLGIPPLGQRFNQAPTLVREADDYIVLDEQFWNQHIAHKTPPPEEPQLPPGTQPEDHARVEGQRFGNGWAQHATIEEILELLGSAPRIPRELDAQLVRQARATLGAALDEDAVRDLRAGFWEAITAARDVRLAS